MAIEEHQFLIMKTRQLIFLILMVCAGCGRSGIEQKIVGRWELRDANTKPGELIYEFGQDGHWSSKQVLPRLTSSTTGAWKLEGRSLVMTPQGRSLVVDGQSKNTAPLTGPERDEIVSLNGSVLVLKMSEKDGPERVATFHRVPGN